MRGFIILIIFMFFLGVASHAVAIPMASMNVTCIEHCLARGGAATLPSVPLAPILLFAVAFVLVALVYPSVSDVRLSARDRLTEPIRLLLQRAALRTVVIRD